jgi:hypothetical protein
MSLAPKLREIKISPMALCLDPNNPRLFSTDAQRIPLNEMHLPGNQRTAEKKIFTENDKYRIDDLTNSIMANGYVPELAGYIFVRKLPNIDQYLVLEGNRRLIALRKIIDDDTLGSEYKELKVSIQEISVKEITDSISEPKLQEKISYLLGTLHQGSSEDWSPFAQAKGILERYLLICDQTKDTFLYDEACANKVASLLSINVKEVKERLCVYVTMQQLSEDEQIRQRLNGGVISKYYSLIKDAVYHNKSKLKGYFPADPYTFRLEPVSIERLDNLCNFNGTKDRRHEDKSAPAANNPKQWNYLNKILEDSDESKRKANLLLIEEHKQHPEDVWAKRYAEMVEMGWKDWLDQVYGLLEVVSIVDTLAANAISTLKELDNVLKELES